MAGRGRAPRVDLLKLSHHGGRTNTSPELLRRFRLAVFSCFGREYLRTSPCRNAHLGDPRLPGLEIAFDYDNAYSRPWAQAASRPRAGFAVRVRGSEGIAVTL